MYPTGSQEELARAKEVDHTSYAEDDSAERKRSTAWEESLYAFLDAHGVAYLTEAALKDQVVRGWVARCCDWFPSLTRFVSPSLSLCRARRARRTACCWTT